MNSELKKKWVEALRSGEYKQAKNELRSRSGAMCCIGVLAAVQGCPPRLLTGEMTSSPPDGYDGGLTERLFTLLAAMNDGAVDYYDNQEYRQHAFPEIADWIEKNIPAEPTHD